MSFSKVLTNLAALSSRLTDKFGTDRCNILREQRTGEGGGTSRVTWAAINDEPLPCFIEAKDTRREVAAGKWEAVADHRIYLQYGVVELTAADRIEILARDNQPRMEFGIFSFFPNLTINLEIRALRQVSPPETDA